MTKRQKAVVDREFRKVPDGRVYRWWTDEQWNYYNELCRLDALRSNDIDWDRIERRTKAILGL
jgi:hypothetical protein